jgi:ABC-type transport system substrate-binding protein
VKPGRCPGRRTRPHFDATKNQLYAFDLDKARSLLASAGVSGFDTVINYAQTGPFSDFAQLAQIYQGDLAKIGVNATIAPMDNATWSDTAKKPACKGMAVGMPSGFGFQDATSGLATGAFGVTGSFSNFQSDDYRQLVKSAGAELDPVHRKDLYSQIKRAARRPVALALPPGGPFSVIAAGHQAVLELDARYDIILHQSFTMTLSSLLQASVWLSKVRGVEITTGNGLSSFTNTSIA